MHVGCKLCFFPGVQCKEEQGRKERKRTTSSLEYDVGKTFRALAVGTTKSGMMAMVLISLAQGNFL